MRSETNGHDNSYDVLILGTGIGGTVLGTILARQGVRVVMVEQGTHPRFAIGESTIPETSIMMRLNRCPGAFTLPGAIRVFAWGRMAAPESIRRNYFRTTPGLRTFSGVRKVQRELVKKDQGATRAMVRDAFRTWNEDFLHY